MLEHMHFEVWRQQLAQLGKAHRHHPVFVVPDLAFIADGLFDSQLQQLLLPFTRVMPTGAEGEQAVRMPGRVRDE